MAQSNSDGDIIERAISLEDEIREARGSFKSVGIVLQLDVGDSCMLKVHTENGNKEYESFENEKRANREFDALVEEYNLKCQC